MFTTVGDGQQTPRERPHKYSSSCPIGAVRAGTVLARCLSVVVMMLMVLFVSAPGSAHAAAARINVTAYAACNGGDDTAGLKSALRALRTGDTLVIPAGVTCRHTGVLSVATPGAHLSGPGTLLATKEKTSAVWIDANDVVVDGGLTLKTAPITKRWETYEQEGLRLVNGRSGIIIRNVTINGAAGAGIYLGGVSNFLLDQVTVLNSRADGIHMTNGSHNGIVRQATVRGSGDDGVAVVSYQSNSQPCHDIQIMTPTVQSNTWGRGISVVGGTNITYTDVSIDSSNAAAIYIAQESSYHTYSVNNVKVLSGRLVNSNTNSSVDHGAVLVYASQSGYGVADVTLSDLTIVNTRASASRNVGVIATGGSTLERVALNRFTITGGPSRSFGANVQSGFTTVGWKVNGVAVPNR